MLYYKKIIYMALLQFCLIVPVQAGDFDWLESLSIEAKADGSGFKTRLATRFDLGDAKVNAVISDVGSGADAYMVMRLGEMSGKNIETVTDVYNANKGKGWGRLAKSLGIKPGSRAFKALKSGHDLSSANQSRGKKNKNKNKNKKNKGKGHNKGNKRNW